MSLHLVKLCVGVDSLADFDARVRARMKAARAQKKPPRMIHVTRMSPKRVDELLAGGSLYWVIKGEIQCRTRLLALEPFRDADGIGRCRLVLEPKLIAVDPRPMRAFQGWRYLAAKDAPADLTPRGKGAAALPEHLRRELRELGLL